MLHTPCKAPTHLNCESNLDLQSNRSDLQHLPPYALMLPQKARHMVIDLGSCQVSVGHYLHSLERFSEAAAAYEAAAAACAPACAPSGARRAAELYRGLALLGTGASADLEAACGLLHQRTSADTADSTSQVTL